MWFFNVFFHLNVNVQNEQLYEMRVYGRSLWFILPTETRLAALTANCPSMCAVGHPVTTWKRHTNYGQFTAMVLEVQNIVPANRVVRHIPCSKGYINT